MLGMLASGLQSGLQTGLQGLRTVFGMLRGALGAIASMFRFVGGHLMGFAGLLMRLGGLLAGVVIGGLVSFVAAIGASTKAASEHARAIIDLRNSTGMSTGQAQGIAGRFGAFGIGPDALSNGGQYHGITRMTGRAFGVDPFDPASINRRAQSFGSGMMGFQMRQSMLSSIGQNNAQGQWLANLPSNKVASQVAFQQNASASMGITPDVTRRLAEDLPLVIQRFSVLKDLLVSKIAAAALPYLEKALTRLSEFLAKNGEEIANGIGKAIEWTMNALAQLGEFLLQNGPMIADAIKRTISWLYIEAPPLILRGLSWILGGVSSFLGAMETGAKWIGENSLQILQVFDAIYNGLRFFASNAFGIAGMLTQAWSDFKGGQIQSDGQKKTTIQADLAFPDRFNFLSTAANAGAAVSGANAIGAFDASKRDFLNAVPAGNLAQYAPNVSQFFGNASDRLGGARSTVDEYQSKLNKIIDSLESTKQEKYDAIEGFYKEMVSEQKKGNQAAAQIANNTGKTADKIGGFASNTIARTLSYISQDAYLGVVGV